MTAGDEPVAGATAAGGLGQRFWLVWTAAATSAVGDGVRYVAFPLLAADLSRDPRAVALVFGAGFLPWPLFGLLAGAIADRADRRRLMWSTDLVRGAIGVALTIAVAAQTGSIAVLAVAAFGLGTAQTVFDNAASAILPTTRHRSAWTR
jgi:MFS family permease